MGESGEGEEKKGEGREVGEEKGGKGEGKDRAPKLLLNQGSSESYLFIYLKFSTDI